MAGLPAPGRPLTVDGYIALGEDDEYRWELQEGLLAMMPSPTPDHMVAVMQLYARLKEDLPPDLVVVPSVDVDLQLAASDEPATVRRPDLVVVDRTEYDRCKGGDAILRACGARLVVEIVSTGSRRMDYLTKRAEYAEAGIPHYWIFDLEPTVQLLALRRAKERTYDGDEVTGTFKATSPCSVTIQLDQLGRS
ncbi:Uma2 family endonuclease [Nocardia colli]|uniref:Uma2 family endonuclease n=1 Tax=Nocardia colli TaxID=2545717 RepID=A0A5N0EKN1_9NOCA|nr:Uma2 family endonuclease [Nocardia colli]KAA8889812.1 Uma2 family endonuclease [Nocardia colli]